MKRATKLLVGTCLVAVMSPTILAQDVTTPPPEPPPSDTLGSRLIAWSALQKPQPLDQPGPESARSQSRDPQPVRAADPAARRLPASPACPDTQKPDTQKEDKPQGNK